MIQLCGDGHEEICHEGSCPACELIRKLNDSDDECSKALAERDESKSENSDLSKENDQLKGEVSRLESEIEHLKAKLDSQP